MSFGMWRRAVLYTSTNASDGSAISIFRVYKQAYWSTQKLQAACSASGSATMYQETRRHIQEDLVCIKKPVRTFSLVNRTFSHSLCHRVAPNRASWPDKVVPSLLPSAWPHTPAERFVLLTLNTTIDIYSYSRRCWASSSSSASQEIPTHFTDTEISLECSQQLTTCPSPEPH